MITFLDNPQQNRNPYMRYSKFFQPEQKPAAPKRDQRIRPVQTVEQLLETTERKPLLQEIQDLSAASSKHYQAFYEPLINNFAEFVQQLEHIDHPSITWLDHHLRLAKTTLKMREQFLLVGESLHPILNKDEALWHYVAFSSALLRKIGLLFTDYQVSICNEQGVHQAEWMPFLGSMNTQGQYYKLREITNKGIPYSQGMNLLLARQLMPNEGFCWIASNPMALKEWLGVVEGESPGGVILQFLALSEKQLYELAKQEELLEELFRAQSLEELLRLTGLSEQELLKLLPPLHGAENDTTETAVAFFDWLEAQQELLQATGQTGSRLLLSERQYLLSPISLAFIARECPGLFSNWFNLYKKSMSLGFTPLTSSEKALRTFLTHSTILQQATTPVAKTSTTDLFHKTLHENAAPTVPSLDTKKESITHQDNVKQTVQALNNQGLMVSNYMHSAYTRMQTTDAQQQQQHAQNLLTQYVDSKDYESKMSTLAHQLNLEYQQRMQTRQAQLHQMIQLQYPQPEPKKSVFSYSMKTQF